VGKAREESARGLSLYHPPMQDDRRQTPAEPTAAERFRVALTFDTEHSEYSGEPANTLRLLEILSSERVVATFFVQGQWASAHPSVARRIADEGHLIGNHSQWHAPLPLLSRRGVRETVRRAEEAIVSAAGVDPRPWFRCPYGKGTHDRRIRRILRRLGYSAVGWNVENRDYRPGIPPERVAEATVSGAVTHGDGAIVLLHDWPDATVDALPAMISGLQAARAQFVAVDALLPDPGGAAGRGRA